MCSLTSLAGAGWFSANIMSISLSKSETDCAQFAKPLAPNDVRMSEASCNRHSSLETVYSEITSTSPVAKLLIA